MKPLRIRLYIKLPQNGSKTFGRYFIDRRSLRGDIITADVIRKMVLFRRFLKREDPLVFSQRRLPDMRGYPLAFYKRRSSNLL